MMGPWFKLGTHDGVLRRFKLGTHDGVLGSN